MHTCNKVNSAKGIRVRYHVTAIYRGFYQIFNDNYRLTPKITVFFIIFKDMIVIILCKKYIIWLKSKNLLNGLEKYMSKKYS